MSQCPRPLRCSRCKQEGHKSFQCSKPTICYNCGKDGHFIRHCPNPVRCLLCNSEDHFTRHCPTYPLICAKCGVKGHKTVDCLRRKEEPDTENNPITERGIKKHVTDTATTSDGDSQPPKVTQAAPVPVPRHRVQHPPPGPAPVPAPRRVRDVESGQITLGSKDEVQKEIKSKMRQDKKLEKTGFDRESIDPLLMDNVKKSRYSIPPQFLLQIVPLIQDNKFDVMTCSNTESRHTAAFLITIISKFMEENIGSHPEEGNCPVKLECVIITPTRESSARISTLAKTLTEATSIRVVVTSGDTSVQKQMEDVRRGCNILISTPGRLLYFVKENIASFSNVKILLLDRADRLMAEDFKECVQKIVTSETMPKVEDRQTLIQCENFNDEILRSLGISPVISFVE